MRPDESRSGAQLQQFLGEARKEHGRAGYQTVARDAEQREIAARFAEPASFRHLPNSSSLEAPPLAVPGVVPRESAGNSSRVRG